MLRPTNYFATSEDQLTRDKIEAMREAWSWFVSLVARVVQEIRHKRSQSTTSLYGRRPEEALEHALFRLGLSFAATRTAVCSNIGVLSPTSKLPANGWQSLDLDALGVLLPLLLDHPDEQLAAMANAWLADERTWLALPPDLLEHWLVSTVDFLEAHRCQLATRGLALLGPHALLRVRTLARCNGVQHAASQALSVVVDIESLRIVAPPHRA